MNSLGQTDRPVFSIEVRDRRNPDRVLGRLVKKPTERLRGDILHVAIRRKLELLLPLSPKPQPMDPVDVRRVTFDVAFRSSWDGYDRAAELLTDNPLEDLLMLPEFRLPGEAEQQAKHRLGMF